VGTQQTGQVCGQDLECVSGLACDRSSGGACGTCQVENLAGENQSCTQLDCQDGLECNPSKVCVKQPKEGEVCNLDNQGNAVVSCSTDAGLAVVLYCKPDSQGAATGKCTRQGLLDAACSDADPCHSIYQCVGSKCALLPRTGEPCTFDPQETWGVYKVCLFSVAVVASEYCRPGANPGAGQCQPLPQENEVCGTLPSSRLCSSGLYCTSPTGAGTCRPRQEAGATCQPTLFGADCQSFKCVDPGGGAPATCAAKEVCP
jgi:hypothetical protein